MFKTLTCWLVESTFFLRLPNVLFLKKKNILVAEILDIVASTENDLNDIDAFPPVSSTMACWKMHHVWLIFLLFNLHLANDLWGF